MARSDNPLGDAAVRPEMSDGGRSLMLLDRTHWRFLSRRYELTPREVQIADLVCQGLRQGSIARRLRIQPGTVKAHIRNIYRKVKVKSKMNMLLRFVSEARGASKDRDGP
ncbi:MAG TPA: LuxR C-terminal-related transcriptional regulator [Sedimentisphaerales bacterium]|jgi:DNA-binding CsgD family transcriptional regulator|nr:LuxR C-terminal-related transcriptional regulator [Sedimentisphaerales bacterium]HNU29415.1 LuxR C-terminal-related transcriptional regulator [Sedimentisphaerales bacterium]